MYQKTWSKKGFFAGDNDRPLTRLERDALAALSGATAMVVLIRLYQCWEFLNR